MWFHGDKRVKLYTTSNLQVYKYKIFPLQQSLQAYSRRATTIFCTRRFTRVKSAENPLWGRISVRLEYVIQI